MRISFYHQWRSMRFLALPVVLVLGLPAAAVAVPPAAAREALARVDSLLAAGATAAAAECALDAVRRWRDEPLYGWQVQGRAGAALIADGRASEALPLLEAAVRAHPRDSSSHHQLALALTALGRRGRALAEFDEAATLDPTAVAPRLEAGRLRGAMGDWRGAFADLEAARVLCGGCPGPDRLQGTILLAAGRPVEALGPLRRLWSTHPDPDIRHHLLAALAAAGEDSALLDLVASTPPRERTRDDWRMAIQAEGHLGGLDWAAAALAAAAAADNSTVPVEEDVFWAQASLNLLAAGRASAALEAVDRALALAPGRAVYHHNRAAALAALGRHDEARLALAAAERAGMQDRQGERP